MKRYFNTESLNGKWKFHLDPEGTGDFQEPDGTIKSWQRETTFFDKEFPDKNWAEINVPNCWQAEGYNYNGVAWYRTNFNYQDDGINNVIRLLFKGVDYYADVWLNGYFIGSHEGFFQHFAFDVSRWIVNGKNLLTVKVENPNVQRTLMKGALQNINWDCNDPTVDPGGIYNDVQILRSKDIYIDSLKPTGFVKLSESSAKVLCQVSIFNTTKITKSLRIESILSPNNFSGESYSSNKNLEVPPGKSQTNLWVSVTKAKLWWPWDMGNQNLYDIKVTITEQSDTLDQVSDRVGLRHLHKEEGNWVSYLNGKRIFARGPNYLSEQLQSNMNRKKYQEDVTLMREANMNMVRSYCVVEKEEFYDVCDEVGIMVYQDFPTTGRASNTGSFLRRATIQARELVNQLYCHPSIVIWCWGAQPGIKNFEKLCLALANACSEEDPHRFIQQGSSVWQWQTAKEKFDWPIDFHLLAGWFHPDDRFGPFLSMERDECNSGYSVEELKIKRKELLEFVSEYGPPEALPNMESLKKIIPAKDRWPVNWDTYAQHRLHGDILMRWIEEPDSLEDLILKSQEYQAFHLKYHTEFYRRHKFIPCNGALFFQFKDCWPAVTAAVVDYYGSKKKAYYTMQQAFNPIHIIMDWPTISGERAGSLFSKEIFIVNDYHYEYPDIKISWQITDQENQTLQQKTFSRPIPENSLTVVDNIEWTIPDNGDSLYKIYFEISDTTGILAANSYELKTK